MIKKYLTNLIDTSYIKNSSNILKLLAYNPDASLLDLGCNDGSWTVCLADKIGTSELWGLDIVEDRLRIAKSRGVHVKRGDLNSILPFKDGIFDVIHANQVIEHLYDTDRFLEEIYRVLKPNGYAIISTENLSSWHNIFALVLGFQPFSMSNYSSKGNIGNPFALWSGKISTNSAVSSWQHNRLFSYFGLKNLLERHGFVVITGITSGYYPSFLDFSSVDKLHGHWMTFKILKPLEEPLT